MVSEQDLMETAPVSCEVCHIEIPRTESLSIEAKEYVYYFCGHGCFSRWSERVEERVKDKPHRSKSRK